MVSMPRRTTFVVPSSVVTEGRRGLEPAQPQSAEQVVEIDSGELGRWRLRFGAAHDPRAGRWDWLMTGGERID